MDTNEACEAENDSLGPYMFPLAPYSSSFRYKYSKHGRCLENSPSPWKGDDQGQLEFDRRLKRRRVENLSSSSFLRLLDRDSLLHALSRVDFPSLIRCMSVEKSLRMMILSPELRRLWTQKNNKRPVVLVTSHTLPCLLWVPGTPPGATVQAFQPFAPGSGKRNPLVVASHRGLVCLKFQETYKGLNLAVGNPLTGEWVALPKSAVFLELTAHRYTMEVEEPSCFRKASVVNFRVASWCTSPDTHCYHVFDSVTGRWSSTSFNFPPRNAFKWSAFDLRSMSWKTELIRGWEVKTGLERTSSEVHRLPHPCLHGFAHWEHKGSTYFASPWTVKQLRYQTYDNAGEFAGYGVWKVLESGERLETVSAVWGVEVGASPLGIQMNVSSENWGVSCSASENLVFFDGVSSASPSMPVVVFDLETGRWTPFDEQHEATDEWSVPGNHYAAAVAYSPSLLVAPFRGPKLDSESGGVSVSDSHSDHCAAMSSGKVVDSSENYEEKEISQ